MKTTIFRRIGALLLVLSLLATSIPFNVFKNDEISIPNSERIEMASLIPDLCWFMVKNGLEDLSQSSTSKLVPGLPLPFAALQWCAANPEFLDYIQRSLDQVMKGNSME